MAGMGRSSSKNKNKRISEQQGMRHTEQDAHCSTHFDLTYGERSSIRSSSDGPYFEKDTRHSGSSPEDGFLPYKNEEEQRRELQKIRNELKESMFALRSQMIEKIEKETNKLSLPSLLKQISRNAQTESDRLLQLKDSQSRLRRDLDQKIETDSDNYINLRNSIRVLKRDMDLQKEHDSKRYTEVQRSVESLRRDLDQKTDLYSQLQTALRGLWTEINQQIEVISQNQNQLHESLNALQTEINRTAETNAKNDVWLNDTLSSLSREVKRNGEASVHMKECLQKDINQAILKSISQLQETEGALRKEMDKIISKNMIQMQEVESSLRREVKRKQENLERKYVQLQELARTVQREIQQKLDAYNNNHLQLETFVRKEVEQSEQLRESVRALEEQTAHIHTAFNHFRNSLPSPVTFYATLSKITRKAGVIHYDRVDINVGNAYNRGTGMFFAPSSGVYMFSVSSYGEQDTALFITNNDRPVCAATQSSGKQWCFFGTSVVLRLNQLEVISVKLHRGRVGGDGVYGLSSFTGLRVG